MVRNIRSKSAIANPARNLALALCLALASPALADEIKDAKYAIGLGDYAKAVEILKPLVEAGNAEAQFELGVLTSLGQGVPKDIPAAINLLKRSAEHGSADAQYSLGHEYSLKELVDGVDLFPEDYQEAYFWFALAADGYAALGRGKIDGAKEMRDITGRKLSDAERLAVDARITAWQDTH